MSENALLSQYQKAERDDLTAWLMSFKGQETQQPAQDKAQQKPAEKPKEERPAGFFNSMKRAAVAPVERFKEGAGQVKEAVSPTAGKEQSPLAQYIGEGGARVVEGAMGALNMAFPFSAAAGSVARDVNAALPQVTDEQIKAQIDALRAQATQEAAVGVPGGGTAANQIKQLEALLLMPADQRQAQSEESAAMAAEMGAGLISGYTAAAKGISALAGRGTTQAAKAARAEAVARAGEMTVQKVTAQEAATAAGPSRAPDASMTRMGRPGGMTPAKPATRAPQTMDELKALKAGDRFKILNEDPQARQAINDTINAWRNKGDEGAQGAVRAPEPEPQAPSSLHPHEEPVRPAEPLSAEDLKVADEYDQAITDPKSKPAWDRLADDTSKKYEDVLKEVQVERVTGQPYASAEEMNKDIAAGRFKVTTDNSEHPFWDVDANWKFRVVHDYYGHYKTGFDFSLEGEKKAYAAHAAAVADPDAKHALFTEVVGQAASYTKNAEFGEQKAFLAKNAPEMLTLEHYSPQEGLTSVDPKFFGTGSAGRETRRASEAGFQPRSYYYTAGTTPEARFARMHKYQTEVPASRVFDIASAEGKALLAEVGNNPTALEAALRERGFGGYRNSALNAPEGGKYGQTMGNAVAWFEPQAVRAADQAAPVSVKAYHGTRSTFGDYAPSETYGGSWFAEKPETANYYAGKGGDSAAVGDAPQIRPVSLRLKRPAPEGLYHETLDLMQGDPQLAAEALKARGYDGVSFGGVETGKGPHYLVFDPNTATVPYFGSVAAKLEDGGVEAAKQRIRARMAELKDALTNEAGVFKLRGEFADGWEKNKKLVNDLVTVGNSYLWEGVRGFKEWSERMVQEFGDVVRPMLEKLYPKAQAELKDMLAKAQSKMPTAKEMLTKFHEGSYMAEWYDNAMDEFRTIFGVHADLFADLIAATSPMSDVKSNITLAFKAMELIMSGEVGAGRAFRSSDGFIGAHLNNLNRILNGQPVSGPKVGPFAAAIKGDRHAVVVDRWMLRAYGFPPGASGDIDPSDARVLFIQRHITDMARELGMDERQVQAAIWTAQKVREEGEQDIKALSAMVHDHIKNRGLERDWLFPKAVEENVPSWVKEEGRVNLGVLMVLGRAAAGAVAGSMTGDDPETSARNMLLAAGISSLLSPKLAKNIAKAITDPEMRQIVADAVKGQEGALKFPKREPSPNTEYMGASNEAKRLVRGINEKLEAAGRLERAGVQTHEDTIAAAARSPYKDVEKVLALDAATLKPEDLAAARTAARGVRDAVAEAVIQSAARAKVSGDAADLADMRQQFNLAQAVSRRVTDLETAIARGQEAGKIKSSSALASKYDLDALSKELVELDETFKQGSNVSDIQLVEMLTQRADRAAAAKIAATASKWPSALWNIYYGLNLLSSPMTQLRNVIGNGGALTMAVADRAAGEILGPVFRVAGQAQTVQPGETYEMVKGIWQSVADSFRGGKDSALEAAKEAYRTGESALGIGKESDALLALQSAEELGAGALGHVVFAMNTLAQKNLRFMGGVDEFYKTLSFHGELRSLAQREAKSTGLKGKELVREVERLVADPTVDMLAQATAFAKENTFTKAFNKGDKRWQTLAGAGADIETAASTGVARLLATPFFRTPMRIAEFATVHTPGLNLLAVQFSSDIAAGGVKRNLAMAKLATGSAMIGLTGWYASHGYITGNWPTDPNLKATYEKAGWQPKSIYNPMTGKYYSYDNLEPISSIVATTADFFQIARDLPEWDAQTMFMALSLAAGKNAIAKQWFQSISDIGDIIESTEKHEDIKKGMDFLARRVATLIPGASFNRWVNQTIDSEKREKETVAHTDPELREVSSLYRHYTQNIPGWALVAGDHPAVVDNITGEPLPSNMSWSGGVNPFRVSTNRNNKVLNELAALEGAGIPRELPRVLAGNKPSAYDMPQTPEREIREGVRLSDQERGRLGKLLTKVVKDDDGHTLEQAMAAMMDTEEYKDASDGRFGGKAERMGRIYEGFMREATARLFEEYPRLESVVNRRKLERQLGRMPMSEESTKEDARGLLESLSR